MRRLTLSTALIAAAAIAAAACDTDIRGYFKAMPVYWKQQPLYYGGEEWNRNAIFHARQNLKMYPSNWATLGLEFKTRAFTGDNANQLLSAADVFGQAAFFDWDKTFIEEDNAVVASVIDRAWLDLFIGEVQLTMGRQRIAWGTNLVWNPIDIFNSSSPLDFDNEEKPGTDAFRLQWYTGPASKFEFAVEPRKETEDATVAFLTKVNKWDYDFILMGGLLGKDVKALGAAWAGDIAGGGFRGEILYSVRKHLRPDIQSYSTPLHRQYLYKKNLTACVSGDYTFKNSFYLHGAILYNQRGTTKDAGGLRLYQALLDRRLTPAKLSLFAQIGQELHPLVRADIFGIANPYDGSWYAGPTVTWAVITNLDLTVSAMTYGGDAGTEFGDNSELYYARLKWSFGWGMW